MSNNIIKAREGYFLINEDGTIYGEEISLGLNDSAGNYTERPIEEMPMSEEERSERELLSKLLEKYGK